LLDVVRWGAKTDKIVLQKVLTLSVSISSIVTTKTDCFQMWIEPHLLKIKGSGCKTNLNKWDEDLLAESIPPLLLLAGSRANLLSISFLQGLNYTLVVFQANGVKGFKQKTTGFLLKLKAR